VVSRFNEGSLSHLTDAEEYVIAAATGKAEEVAQRRSGIILGVDTDVVASEGDILGKPIDADDAKRMLRRLSGKTHRVYSGVVLLRAKEGIIQQRENRVVATDVTFGDLPDAAIEAYVATGEPLDKAGAYGIQGGGMPFVKRIDGDHSNVIGLPLWTVTELLTQFNVPLWERRDLSPNEKDSRLQ
jgi:septum formation protein